MLDLIKKDVLTEEELKELDLYWDKRCEDSLSLLSVNEICKLIKLSKEVLGYSVYEISLQYHLACNVILDLEFVSYNGDEDISLELNYYEIAKFLHNEGSDYDSYFKICIILASYYLKKDKEKAKDYFYEAFTKAFKLDYSNYTSYLSTYLNMIKNKNQIVDFLEPLLQNIDYCLDYSIDAIDMHLYLIINLEKDDPRYIKYIDQALKIAYKVVREYQDRTKHHSWSDTDEERDLCELLCLKFECYVLNKEYEKAFSMYKDLTEEIGRSDCTRYYHARDKYYYQMLKDMSKDYPELTFFEDIGYYKFKVLEKIDNFVLNQQITLIKEDGSSFNFVVNSIYEDELVIVPLLPLIGLGGKIFVSILIEDGVTYLVNKLSH